MDTNIHLKPGVVVVLTNPPYLGGEGSWISVSWEASLVYI